MWSRERRVQKQPMSLAQMVSLWKAVVMLQIGGVTDVVIMAGAVDCLVMVVMGRSRMWSQKEHNFISKSIGIPLIVHAIAGVPHVHVLHQWLERLKTRRINKRLLL